MINREMKVLQIASFDGNIGDRANHEGFRKEFQKTFGKAEFTNLEMRKFYKSQGGKFDDNFVKLANQYDLVVFGGGAFWELKWEYSVSGNTIDIDSNVLKKISPPILFNCLGTGPKFAYTDGAIEKFGIWLDHIKDNHRVYLTVRNDGTYDSISKLYNRKYDNLIKEIPDGGFFCKVVDSFPDEVKDGYINIAINLGNDLSEIRFPGVGKKISRRQFIYEFSEMLNDLMEENERVRLIFVPHIYSDLKFIFECLELLKDEYVRKRVTISACLNGTETDGMKIFEIYKKCSLVLGMRYHANVVPIGMNIPTIILGTLDDQVDLYRKLNINHRCILVNEEKFKACLWEKIHWILENSEAVRKENLRIVEKLQDENNHFFEDLKKWYISCWG